MNYPKMAMESVILQLVRTYIRLFRSIQLLVLPNRMKLYHFSLIRTAFKCIEALQSIFYF